MERRKVDLSREKVEGDLGDEGLERWKNVGLFLAVLHCSLGLSGAETGVLVEVRQRRPELETGCVCKRGVEGFEKNPVNLVPILGVEMGVELLLCLFCSSWWCFCLDSGSLGIDVQNALLHPRTIFDNYDYMVWFCLFNFREREWFGKEGDGFMEEWIGR